MYLSKLQLLGFKSFARKTDLVFNDGITSIVGPNGCGKTNIVDAIRWVLGEQRFATLRVDRMESLIFNGTANLKPLGMVEVTLTIQNNKNILPSEYSEVEITRRLFRSGESEYLLNRNPCRLKDITELFMDTGMGTDGYSVMELRMVESILSDKADERRRLFEEAAGITKYKQRRKASLKKLEATEVDIIRVNDIINEVERNVAALKRQVGKAKRYQKFSEELKELEIKIGIGEYSRLMSQARPLEVELENKKRILQLKRTELSQQEASFEKTRAELTILEDELTEFQKKSDHVTEEFHRREQAILISRERLTSLKEKITSYEREKDNLNQRVTDVQEQLSSLRKAIKELRIKIEGLQSEYNIKKNKLDDLQQQLDQKRQELEEQRKKDNDVITQLMTKSKKRESINANLQYLRQSFTKLTADNIALKEEVKSITAEEERLLSKENQLRKRLKYLKNQKEESEEEIANLKKNLEYLKEEEFRLRSHVAEQQRKIAFLRELIRSHSAYGEGTKFLLERKVEVPGVLAPLGEILSVGKKYRRAIEAILGPIVEYIVVDKTDTAYEALKILRQNYQGGVTLLPLEKFSDLRLERPPQHAIAKPAILGWANDLVKCDRRYRQLVDFLLGSFLIVENLEAARTWADAAKDSRIEFVTINGEVVSSWGRIRAGFYGTEEVFPSLNKEEQIEEMERELAALNSDLSSNIYSQQQQSEKLRQSTSEAEKVDSTIGECEEENQRLQILLAQCRLTKQKAEERIQENVAVGEELGSKIETFEQILNELRPQIEELEAIKGRSDGVSNLVERDFQQLEKQRAQRVEELHELSLLLERSKGEERRLQSEIERSEALLSEIHQTIEHRHNEVIEANRDLEELSASLLLQEKELQESGSQREILSGEREEREKRYLKLRNTLQEREGKIKELRTEVDATADDLRDLELRISELKMRARTVREGIQEKYNCRITEAASEEYIDEAHLKERIEQLKRRLHSMGTVNLLAIEEHQKESERLQFLKDQRRDLLEAKETLNETIEVINRTARNRFYRVFNLIKGNFRKTFTTFFEGGEADLELDFKEDFLEADIKILTKPKGKRLTPLNLLSGGEKALTAIALLFAIYQVKPSPFCILDEIDAPLDDINVTRFLKVLKKFSENTQFIVVTHNKSTMEASDYLYGVTMEEEGISKIISVRFPPRAVEKPIDDVEL